MTARNIRGGLGAIAVVAAALVVTISSRDVSRQQSVRLSIRQILPLQAAEGVFAYARISPDGRFLAYASETTSTTNAPEIQRTIRVVELASRRIVFSERGIDAYWSPDGHRVVFLSLESPSYGVSIWDQRTGHVHRNVASPALGDYFSWARRDGRDLILTILGNYYYLGTDGRTSPPRQVQPCPNIGSGERPLISKDGRRITAFVAGTIVIRDLTDCDDIVETGIAGAKADFSWDGRYIAFHSLREAGGQGYEIRVIDVKERSIRTIADLPGSSLFPSWTRDGRLSFRYDGPDFHGFVIADNVLSLPASDLLGASRRLPVRRTWQDIFPETPLGTQRYTLVLVWSTWSAHSAIALKALQDAHEILDRSGFDVDVVTATDNASREIDVNKVIAETGVKIRRVPLDTKRQYLTETTNQMPAVLLFRDGVLIDRRLGAQTSAQLHAMIVSADMGRDS